MSTQRGSMGSGASRKRMKPEVQEKKGDEVESHIVLVQEEGFEAKPIGSEEMELNISLVLEKIENFTQRVSELLESGKAIFKELCNELEEKLMIMIHKEQVEKWQEKIKESVWFLDSGCSNHMYGVKDWFNNLDEQFKETVKLGDNSKMKVIRKGSIKLRYTNTLLLRL